MKFMLMMNAPGKVAYQIAKWPLEDIKAHIAFMKDFNKQLQKAGQFVDGQGLAGPDQAKLVKADNNGQPITDGVFPEAKEFLAGYWIIDVESAERAYAVAAAASMAPGPGGKPMHMAIEVREVMSAPPTDYTP
ncbi:MAG TPA: YciI family protein [Kofleriaceae bacterium]